MDDRTRTDHPDRESGRRDERSRSHGPDAERRGDGPDTRFLQLEMSRVLYAEAEGVTKQAFRELLLDAAKARLRERFGETITRLAELATDELLADIEASLDVEDQIQRRHGSGDAATDGLRAALGRARAERSERPAERAAGRGSAARKRRR